MSSSASESQWPMALTDTIYRQHFLSLIPTSFCLPIFLSVLKMILILLVGDGGERNACFTDQKQGTALEQHWLSVLYHKSLWLYPSSPAFYLSQLWGWWWQDRFHYLNTKKQGYMKSPNSRTLVSQHPN